MMNLNTNALTSIAAIEQHIAKVTAELEKARAFEYTSAEKALVTAQKIVATAEEKVRDLLAKAMTTPAAENRLKVAQAALAEKESAMAIADKKFNAIKNQQEQSQKLTKKVEHVLTSKKLSKKINFSKKEKAALKVIRKSAKAKNKLTKEAEKSTAPLTIEKTVSKEKKPQTKIPLAAKNPKAMRTEEPEGMVINSTLAPTAPEQTPLLEIVLPSSIPETTNSQELEGER